MSLCNVFSASAVTILMGCRSCGSLRKIVKGSSTNSFSAFLLSTARTSIPTNHSPFRRQYSVQPGCRQNQNRGRNHPGQQINRIVVSKINCSKNDERSVGQIDPGPPVRDHAAAPPGEDGQFRVAARKAIVMSGFQPVERALHGLKQPQTTQREVLQVFQKKAWSAGRDQNVPDIRGQESQCD